MKMIDLKKKVNKINIDNILEEYAIDDSIFSEMDIRLRNISKKWDGLSKAEKTLMVLYADTGSYRDVGYLLGISHTTIVRFIDKIRKKLC